MRGDFLGMTTVGRQENSGDSPADCPRITRYSPAFASPKKLLFAVVIAERRKAHASRYRTERVLYKIRWCALPTWYPAGNDFSMTCS